MDLMKDMIELETSWVFQWDIRVKMLLGLGFDDLIDLHVVLLSISISEFIVPFLSVNAHLFMYENCKL